MSIFIIRSLFVCLSDGSPACAICHVYLYIVTWLWVGTLFSTASETTLVVHFIAANLSNHTHTRFSYYHLSHIILLSAHNKLEQQMTRLPPLTVQHPNIQETSSSNPCNQVPVEHPFWIRVVGGFELNFNPIRIEFICKTLCAYHFTRKSSSARRLHSHHPGMHNGTWSWKLGYRDYKFNEILLYNNPVRWLCPARKLPQFIIWQRKAGRPSMQILLWLSNA